MDLPDDQDNPDAAAAAAAAADGQNINVDNPDLVNVQPEQVQEQQPNADAPAAVQEVVNQDQQRVNDQVGGNDANPGPPGPPHGDHGGLPGPGGPNPAGPGAGAGGLHGPPGPVQPPLVQGGLPGPAVPFGQRNPQVPVVAQPLGRLPAPAPNPANAGAQGAAGAPRAPGPLQGAQRSPPRPAFAANLSASRHGVSARIQGVYHRGVDPDAGRPVAFEGSETEDRIVAYFQSQQPPVKSRLFQIIVDKSLSEQEIKWFLNALSSAEAMARHVSADHPHNLLYPESAIPQMARSVYDSIIAYPPTGEWVRDRMDNRRGIRRHLTRKKDTLNSLMSQLEVALPEDKARKWVIFKNVYEDFLRIYWKEAIASAEIRALGDDRVPEEDRKHRVKRWPVVQPILQEAYSLLVAEDMEVPMMFVNITSPTAGTSPSVRRLLQSERELRIKDMAVQDTPYAGAYLPQKEEEGSDNEDEPQPDATVKAKPREDKSDVRRRLSFSEEYEDKVEVKREPPMTPARQPITPQRFDSVQAQRDRARGEVTPILPRPVVQTTSDRGERSWANITSEQHNMLWPPMHLVPPETTGNSPQGEPYVRPEGTGTKPKTSKEPTKNESAEVDLQPLSDSQVIKELLKAIKTQGDNSHSVHAKHEDLPTFSGDYSHFDHFWDIFMGIVDADKKMPTIWKLKKLVGALEGEAAAAVRSFSFKASNYGLVKNRLVERFGRPKLIFTDMFRKIQHHPQVSEKDVVQFRNFTDMVMELVHHLKVYRKDIIIDPDAYAMVIESKLPQETLLAWEKDQEDFRRIYSKPIPDEALLDYLIDFLHQRVEKVKVAIHANPAISKKTENKEVKPPTSNGARPPPRPKTVPRKAVRTSVRKPSRISKALQKPQKKTLENFTTVAEVAAQSRFKRKAQGSDPAKCCFCKGNHAPRFCQVKKPAPDTAAKLVMDAGLCLCCLKEGHRSRDCGNPKACGREGCEKRHHPFLHGQTGSKHPSKP